MRSTIVTVAAVATSAAIPVDRWQRGGFANNMGLSVEITGTLTAKVQFTLDDVFDVTVTPVWFDHATLTGLTASTAGAQLVPCRAIRLNVTAFTSGSASLVVLQTS